MTRLLVDRAKTNWNEWLAANPIAIVAFTTEQLKVIETMAEFFWLQGIRDKGTL